MCLYLLAFLSIAQALSFCDNVRVIEDNGSYVFTSTSGVLANPILNLTQGCAYKFDVNVTCPFFIRDDFAKPLTLAPFGASHAVSPGVTNGTFDFNATFITPITYQCFNQTHLSNQIIITEGNSSCGQNSQHYGTVTWTFDSTYQLLEWEVFATPPALPTDLSLETSARETGPDSVSLGLKLSSFSSRTGSRGLKKSLLLYWTESHPLPLRVRFFVSIVPSKPNVTTIEKNRFFLGFSPNPDHSFVKFNRTGRISPSSTTYELNHWYLIDIHFDWLAYTYKLYVESAGTPHVTAVVPHSYPILYVIPPDQFHLSTLSTGSKDLAWYFGTVENGTSFLLDDLQIFYPPQCGCENATWDTNPTGPISCCPYGFMGANCSIALAEGCAAGNASNCHLCSDPFAEEQNGTCVCLEGYWLPQGNTRCVACNCTASNSHSEVCDRVTGNCPCISPTPNRDCSVEDRCDTITCGSAEICDDVGGAHCVCEDGFVNITGVCTDVCDTLDCGLNEACLSFPVARCVCSPGLYNVSGVCQETVPCDAFPCGDNRTCTPANTTELGRICPCDARHWGVDNKCDWDVVACDIAPYPCNQFAHCAPPKMDGPDKNHCSCHMGWFGDGRACRSDKMPRSKRLYLEMNISLDLVRTSAWEQSFMQALAAASNSHIAHFRLLDHDIIAANQSKIFVDVLDLNDNETLDKFNLSDLYNSSKTYVSPDEVLTRIQEVIKNPNVTESPLLVMGVTAVTPLDEPEGTGGGAPRPTRPDNDNHTWELLLAVILAIIIVAGARVLHHRFFQIGSTSCKLHPVFGGPTGCD